MGKLTCKMTGLTPDTPFTDDIERAQTLYFNWLCNMVHVDSFDGHSWYILAKLLHNAEFYAVLPMDDNRGLDGVRMRNVWLSGIENEAEDLGVGHPTVPMDSLSGPCTVFEMLVGLAVRIESDLMQNSEKGNRTATWFWNMIRNWFFGKGRNTRLFVNWSDKFIDEEHGEMVKHSIQELLDREYGPNGEGGLFPLSQPDEDQRQVEIWFQAQDWLEEAYSEEFYSEKSIYDDLSY